MSTLTDIWGNAQAGARAGSRIGGVLGGLITDDPAGVAAGGVAGGAVGGVAGAGYGVYQAVKGAEKLDDAAKDKACEKCPPKIKDNPCEHLKLGKGEGDFRGGAHEKTSYPKGDNKDSHHIPAKNIYKDYFNVDDGPAIQMRPEHHKLTKSYGRSADTIKYREEQKALLEQGRFRDAVQMDIDDAKKIAEEAGEKGLYDAASDEAQAYAKCLEENGINPKGDPNRK